ncbi:cAMP-binding domain of CRP or a regulatory subunit of cAMP-dependent protein kinases [Novosphingobium panipatense]|uniref:cAMP-binding domain of CRP or a regulatory subunit of cAMP-dependent protein kinases n=1 Tax=Novosphingobium panipatense TaxID=428991 RepID=A0ABY1QMN3_9SPHN|nr:cAMP-binding domain of CRP or a regulatory subunit of cAMP-dependent protein kinases [Novosphingobium panipatense]
MTAYCSFGNRSHLSLHLPAFANLTEADREILDTVLNRRVRVLPPRHDIIREGDRPGHVCFILDGWAQRYKQLADGRRQILSFFVAGDLCDANVFIPCAMDHSLSTITQVQLAEVAKPDLRELAEAIPRVGEALRRTEQVAIAIQREWTTSIGQRTAYERIAHLFCEMFMRLRDGGATQGDTCDFPLTQSDIADATGLTQVHVNRTIQEMRRDGLIELRNRQLTMHDLDRLMAVALFNPHYLHLDPAESQHQPV